MQKLLTGAFFISTLGMIALLAQTKKPPAKVVLPAKNGNVVFDHSAHLKRAKNDCKVCHPALFAQDAKAAIGFRPPHKTVEDKMASCGSCHRDGGTAFETKANCTNGRCQVKAAAPKKASAREHRGNGLSLLAVSSQWLPVTIRSSLSIVWN